MLYEVITLVDGAGLSRVGRGPADRGRPVRGRVGIVREGADIVPVQPGIGNVITSYSIHYTKLYDEKALARAKGRQHRFRRVKFTYGEKLDGTGLSAGLQLRLANGSRYAFEIFRDTHGVTPSSYSASEKRRKSSTERVSALARG